MGNLLNRSQMKTYTATLAALFAASAEARMWFGECPAIEWDTGFDHSAFAGQWYEQERDAWFTFEMDQMCSQANYVMRSDGKMDVQYGAMIPMTFWTWGYSPKGVMDCSGGYNCQLTMGEEQDEPNTWGVLGTANANWHVAYFRGSVMGMQMSWLAIYGKQQQISEEHMAEAYAVIEAKLPGYAMGWPWTKKSV